MKYLFAFLFLFLLSYNSNASVYDKLCDVNKLWQENDITNIHFPEEAKTKTSQEWIQLHLSMVEQVLRSRGTANLSAEQRFNRNTALDRLHEYWLAGKFPQNTEYNYRTPIFIDQYDNFCAVGYLVKATGREEISRMISSKTNLAYVREIHYPELDNWAKEYGFTKDELAWIQPSYSPDNYAYSVANGTNGNVNELFVDSSGDKMYVGGVFSKVDDTMSVANIGYLTEMNNFYTWHKLGDGLNGLVTAITEYNGNIIAAGSFTASGSTTVNNVARWNGSTWSSLGCLSGSIKDLVVFQGDLYASGRFDICSGDTAVAFAHWDGVTWNAIIGVKGKVNTMMVVDTFLYLGGAFAYSSVQTNAIKWNSNIGFQNFNRNPLNEVNAFTQYGDTLYAGCKITSMSHPAALELCVNNTWEIDTSSITKILHNVGSINSFCALADTILAGGDFDGYSGLINMMNCIPIKNFTNITYNGFNNSFNVDSSINKFAVFKNNIIAGGDFTSSLVYRSLNKRFSAIYYFLDICDVAEGGTIFIYTYDGKLPYTYLWSTGDTTDVVDSLSPGNYSVTVIDADGQKQVLHIKLKNTGFTQPLQYDLTNQKLIAQPGFNVYMLADCDDNYRVLLTRSANSFSIYRDGNYAVIAEKKGCSDTSDCISIKLVPDNVSTINVDDNIHIYPNPATGFVSVKVNSSAILEIDLVDVTGRTVSHWANSSSQYLQIKTTGLTQGFYTLVIRCDDGRIHKSKLIVQ